jgi:serpin B
MRTLLAATAVVLALAPAPAGADKPAPPAGDPVVNANNAFAGDLLRAIREDDGNLFFSPYSISVALAMTLEGARDDTAREMAETLQLPVGGAGDGHARLAEALRPRKVQTDDGEADAYRLSIANALWAQSGYAFVPEFGAGLESRYAARFVPIDFRAAAEARQTINDWVAKETQDRIKDLLPEGVPTTDTRLVLTNAVYFKAAWQEPFQERATEDGEFTTGKGSKAKVRFMRRTDRFRYGESERAQVLEIPYVGGDMSMVVVLPKAKDGLADLETKEGIETWTGLLQGASTKVALKLPKFTFTAPLDLTRTLQGMGMRRAFDPKAADFSGITREEPLFIGAVIHKAFVAVDEHGTEAAAATAVAMRAGSAPRPEEPVPFVADHPFLFLVRHRPTGAVLFLGRVADPARS